ncbi:MAG: TolC family protein [Deltaproteobacteria bacterium]|nr:TolC family protein [Deltaproteobacteria bacterium]
MRASHIALLLVIPSVWPTDGPADTLTEDEAVVLALEHNPGLRAAVLDRLAGEAAIRAAEHAYEPVLSAGASGGHTESSGGELGSSDGLAVDAGVAWTSPWGTSVSAGVSGSWYDREVTGASLGSTERQPALGVEARVDAAQPLLRGAGLDVGEAELRAARLADVAARYALDEEAAALVSDVRTAYWELWYAQAALRVQTAAHELAVRQVAEAQARAEALGLLADSEVLRFASAEVSLAESLAQAEADGRTQAVELGRLLDLPVEQAQALEAVEPGAAPAVPDSMARVTELARESSSTLLRLAAQVAATREQVAVAEDALQPRLDLTVAFAVGESWTGADYIATWDRPYFTATAGLRLEFPFANDRAEGRLAEAQYQADSAQARFDEQAGAVAAEAAILLDRHGTARHRLELAQQSADAARRLAEAERGRLQLGLSTALEVVQAQEDQRGAELRCLRAAVDQAAAALAVGRLTGMLLAGDDALVAAE